METNPQPQHRWLEQLVGEWEVESEVVMAPGAEPTKLCGTESVRSLGGLWVLCEGRCEMPGGGAGTTVMTLGFDPARGLFVGTFIASMMTHLWLYEGGLDPELTVLTLDTEGPDPAGDGTIKRFQDIVTVEGGDRRTLASQALGEDGQWHRFMTARYRRISWPDRVPGPTKS